MRGQCKPGAIAEALVNSGGVPPAASDFRRAGGRALRIHEERYPLAYSRRACGRALASGAEAVPGGSATLTQEPKPVPGSHREADTAVGPANSPCAAGAGRGSGGGGRHAPPTTDESPVPVSVTGVYQDLALSEWRVIRSKHRMSRRNA